MPNYVIGREGVTALLRLYNDRDLRRTSWISDRYSGL
jgi:hypothetical protein